MSWEDPSSEIDGLAPTLVEIRRDIHKHPELGFEEIRTQRLIGGWLSKLGYQPQESARTGLIADLHPERHGQAGVRTVALRADIDCLPMPEHTDLPWRSVHDGRAHKCGHDGHTAILLGTAAILAHYRDRVAGNVRLLFQPAEEGVEGGGAKVMVAEGALEGVSEVYGLHNWPGYAKGQLRVTAGPIMAQVHNFEISVRGKGGHGSQPQSCRDPIVAGAALVTALQSVVSRGLSASGGAVVSVCTFEAGTTSNVIPDVARLTGTIRSYSEEVTTRVLSRFREVTAGIGATYGVEVDLALEAGYPVLVNDADCVAAVERVGRQVGMELSREGLPMAGGEDFAYFAKALPSAYFFLGAGLEGEDTPGCHHPDFDFDDGLIPVGMQMFLGLVRERLSA
ncbi:putative hydrolase/peptidase [Plesiocystis pacifica SIR-1]|uniref:Putative hydrolase/peptidase n=1 Tax=Plesiocystis pacifica SIR-1 TaxID=391625 RepID=A6G8U8_9BACT|nr:M20 family metallopeptidase [Plesiocystis pacifica]EDM77758.1 putative hydrolase/peptidase [Plesiocystis pacifica SIR-1]